MAIAVVRRITITEPVRFALALFSGESLKRVRNTARITTSCASSIPRFAETNTVMALALVLTISSPKALAKPKPWTNPKKQMRNTRRLVALFEMIFSTAIAMMDARMVISIATLHGSDRVIT